MSYLSVYKMVTVRLHGLLQDFPMSPPQIFALLSWAPELKYVQIQIYVTPVLTHVTLFNFHSTFRF